MMNGTPQDESNGYMCNISNDANNDGILKKTSFDSMRKWWNEERNGEEKHEQGNNENGGRNSHIPSKNRFAW
jgi:hypothetical protein